MISITTNLNITMPNIHTSTTVLGGSPPYIFTTDLGSVDEYGVFTTPDYGVATITVIDDEGASASTTISVLNIMQVIANIIKTDLNLDNDQIFLYNQRYLIPSDDRVYVSISVLDCIPYSNTITDDFEIANTSIQSTNFKSSLRIEFFSNGFKALNLKEYIQMTLSGDYSSEVQDFLNIHIAKIPTSFIDSSYAEGSKILYKFSIDTVVQYVIIKNVNRKFYTEFNEPIITTG